MAEENTEFEKAHGKAVTNFSHVFFSSHGKTSTEDSLHILYNTKLMSRQ